MTNHNIMRELKQDLVFERVLGHPSVKNSDQWRETNDCWICNRHDALKIEMNDFRVIKDAEYEEFMQLSSVINEEDQATQ